MASLEAILHGAVSTTAIDEITLIGGRAYAATVARIRRAAALGLALIVLEHEQIVRTQLEGGIVALQRLIGTIITPSTDVIYWLQIDTVKRANRLLANTRRIVKSIRKALIGRATTKAPHR